MATKRTVEVERLVVARELYRFIADEVLPGSGVDPAVFWKGLADLIHDCGPGNRELLRRRAELQAQIDEWHRRNRGSPFDKAAYRGFLEEIGYIEPEGEDFTIETADVDSEIASVPGPQLVVPVTNARFALNAANARWVPSMTPCTVRTLSAIGHRPVRTTLRGASGSSTGAAASWTMSSRSPTGRTRMRPDTRWRTAASSCSRPPVPPRG